MIYRGRVENGVVVLEGDVKLVDGTEVKVEPVEPVEAAHSEEGPTLYERFQNIIGIVDDLPSDMAEQHDHYIHGTPKRP